MDAVRKITGSEIGQHPTQDDSINTNAGGATGSVANEPDSVAMETKKPLQSLNGPVTAEMHNPTEQPNMVRPKSDEAKNSHRNSDTSMWLKMIAIILLAVLFIITLCGVLVAHRKISKKLEETKLRSHASYQS